MLKLRLTACITSMGLFAALACGSSTSTGPSGVSSSTSSAASSGAGGSTSTTSSTGVGGAGGSGGAMCGVESAHCLACMKGCKSDYAWEPNWAQIFQQYLTCTCSAEIAKDDTARQACAEAASNSQTDGFFGCVGNACGGLCH